MDRGQGAKSLELRAATSLAILWESQGKSKKAWALVAPSNGSLKGATPFDLIEAKELLGWIPPLLPGVFAWLPEQRPIRRSGQFGATLVGVWW